MQGLPHESALWRAMYPKSWMWADPSFELRVMELERIDYLYRSEVARASKGHVPEPLRIPRPGREANHRAHKPEEIRAEIRKFRLPRRRRSREVTP